MNQDLVSHTSKNHIVFVSASVFYLWTASLNGMCLLDWPFLSHLKPIASDLSALDTPHVATPPVLPRFRANDASSLYHNTDL